MSVMIEMEHINRIFPVPGGTFQALKDIDAQIDAGTFTILKGRSGSGKTTLLNIIGALDHGIEIMTGEAGNCAPMRLQN